MQSVLFLSPQFDFDLVESLDEVPVSERIDFKQGKGRPSSSTNSLNVVSAVMSPPLRGDLMSVIAHNGFCLNRREPGPPTHPVCEAWRSAGTSIITL